MAQPVPSLSCKTAKLRRLRVVSGQAAERLVSSLDMFSARTEDGLVPVRVGHAGQVTSSFVTSRAALRTAWRTVFGST